MSATDTSPEPDARLIRLEGNPGTSLRRAWPLFSQWVSWSQVRMGGGTALAMRWGHRLSTDVDLAVDIAAFTRMNDERQPEISKALASLKESGEITKFGYRRHIIEIYFPTGPVSLVGSALSGSKATSDQAEFHTGVKLVKTEEILLSKIVGRTLGRGSLLVRDGYDLASAIELDPEPLNSAASRLNDDEWAALVRHMSVVVGQRQRIILGRPLIEPKDPELARDPWRRFAEWVLARRPSP